MRSVGDYQLGPRLGQGGAGSVYAAVHVPTGTPVAVKLLHAATGGHQAVADEVRAAARLDHPHIVTIYDHGVAPRADGPPEPWIAMERAAGSLDRAPLPASWPALHGQLSALLSALGHAHARGVIHRDVKPGNVLLTADGAPLLSDFGIARALDRDEPESPSWFAATPQYAAPEQLARAWRRQGPATDLYALGCLAWELVTGEPLFPGLSGTELARAQALLPPGPFRPRFETPPGLDPWLRALLEKDPRARPPHAAAALAGLPPPATAGDPAPARAPAQVSAPTAVPSVTFRLDTQPGRPGLPAAPPGSRDPDPGPPAVAPPAPAAASPALPSDWRGLEHPARRRPVPLGPALFGWRDPTPIGRDAERDALWGALREGATERRLVLLEGPAGVGKSRVARWLVEAVAETGWARPWRATHAATPGPQDGLAGMLARGLRAAGLDRPGLEVHLARVCAEVDRDLVDVLLGVPLPRAERHAAVTRALGPAPVVAWLDDVHWGADTLRWVAGWLDAGPPGLLVATVRADEPAPEALAEVRAHPATRVLAVGHLEPALAERLVAALVALTPELTRRVARQTDGHPLFTVELLGDWVRRGALVAGAGGYSRPPAAPSLEVPDGIHTLWQARIVRLALLPEDRDALEAAAALGRAAPRSEWRAVGVGAALEERLRVAGLARSSAEEVELAHGLLRDSIEREAVAAGRWADAHGRVADALAAADAAPGRVGGHLHRAGRWDEAVEPLRRGGDLARLANELDVAGSLLALAEESARRAGGDRDPRLPAVWMLSGWVRQLRGDPASSSELAERAWELATELDHARDAGDAASVRAEAARAAGDAPAVEWWLDRAEAAYTRCGHVEGLSDVARVRGALHSMRGDVERARSYIARALDLARQVGGGAALPNTQLVWAAIEGRVGQWERAFALAAEAREGFAAVGSRVRETHARIALAELARRTGRWAEAEAELRALDAGLGPGASAGDSVRLNLALLLLDRGQHAEARQRLMALAAEAHEGRHYASIAVAWLGLAELAAGAGDWEGVAAHVDAWAARTHPSGTHADPDAAARLARLEAEATKQGAERVAAHIRALAARSAWLGGPAPPPTG